MELLDKIIQSFNCLDSEIESVSDRACAIVCGAFLDNLIQELLLEFLCKDSKTQDNKLFSQNGPLATFSSKILLVYRLGLISKYEYDCLNLIRKIRNNFAHNLTIDSFECEIIRELLSNNLPPGELLPPISIPHSYIENGEIIELTMEDILDKHRYESILPKFPPLEFRNYENKNMRSIFLCILYVLQSLLASRLMQAIIERRNTAKELKTIEDIENYKFQYLNTYNNNQVEKLKTLKEQTEFEIKKTEDLFNTDNESKEDLQQVKETLINHLAEINALIKDAERANSMEYATMTHLMELIKYNKGKNIKPI